MPPSTVVEYVPLAHIWSNVVVPKIAQAHGYVEDAGETVKEALDWLDSDRDENRGSNAPDRAEPLPGKPADGAEGMDRDEVEVTADDIKIS